ncbi:MAG TPA: amino acid adenylation domain-containing protein [Stenomitos sp.]
MPFEDEGRQDLSSDAAADFEGPDIAIVSMVGRFPGAGDIETFWQNIRQARSAIRSLSDEELDELQVPQEDRANPRFVPAAAPFDGVEEFDAEFFGYSPREAELLDPQQRLFLECAWEALEEAGYDPQAIPGFAGVFAGATTSHYLLLNLASRPELARGGGQLQLFVANTGDSLATRVSHKLNLRGPSFSVQSACSTSLLAVHLACQSLLNEECDLAVVGGVSVNLAQRGGYLSEEGSILAPNGVCTPFDASAQGTVFGSGIGVVVLKRLARAVADGDPIRAVIRGSAVNNDGRAKAGFTAPSLDGQAAVIAEALAVSGVSAEEIGYVEAHGTGTSLGDPIEIHALTRAFGTTTKRKQFCPVGSLKGAIGHLDVASGIAGLIKAALCVENGEIPPSPGFDRPNPEIDFANSPVYVNRQLQAWRHDGGPRRAGVSSFGIGGTNVHAVLEEAPRVNRPRPAKTDELLVVSARSKSALESALARLRDHLDAHPDSDLTSIAYTLQVGRHPFRHRCAFVARDLAHARQVLAGKAHQTPVARGETEADRACDVAFLFPGQGTQYLTMGAELYRTQPTFRAELDRCARILQGHLGRDIRELIFATGEPGSKAALDLTETSIAQPALFAVEYALAKTWMALGIQPTAMLGHSLGEYVAACLAGVFELSDALSVVAVRGRLMGSLPHGAMLSIAVPEADCSPLLVPGISVAAVNEAGRCVVAGPLEAIDAVSARLDAEGIAYRRLETSHAFHSAMMEPVLDEFRDHVRRVPLKRPQVPFISNVTGTWIRPEEAMDPHYWAQHLRLPVRFADGLAMLRSAPSRVVLEVGPRQSLTAIARRSGLRTAIASMPAPGEGSEQSTLLHALGELWTTGGRPNWDALHGSAKPRRVKLPTYPFERRRYWIARRIPSAVEPVTIAEVSSVVEQAFHPRPELQHALIAPRTDVERAIADVWRQVLGISEIGVEDDFFACGGDSLLATQIATRLQTIYGAAFSLRAILELRTIAKLAELVSQEDGGAKMAGPFPEAAVLRVERHHDGHLPLSFSQERLWFLDQLDPNSSTYNIPAALRLKGSLDVVALERSLNEIVRRHEVLRTTFAKVNGEPVQVIHPALSLPLPVIDLQHLAKDEREAEARRLAAEEARRPFDLAQGPLLHASLLKLGEGEHWFLFNMHHIVSDGWSMGVLVDELVSLYSAFSQGRPSTLPELPIQYADFAHWQQHYLQGEVLDQQVTYWKERLQDAPSLLELPTDRPRPAIRGTQGATKAFRLSKALADKLQDLSRKEGATLFMTLLAAFQTLMYRYSGQEDVVVGSPIANRNRAEIEPLIGFFVNTLALRADLSGKPTFRQLLGQVKETTLGAYAHQDVPFEKLVEALQPERNLSHTPIFQVMFVLQNNPGGTLQLPGVSLEMLSSDSQTAKFDLTLSMEETEDGLMGTWEYATDLFDEPTILRMDEHYEMLLQGISAAPDTPVGQLPLLFEAERHQLMVEWNETARNYPTDTTLHQQFEQQVERTPDAVAAVYGDNSLTYDELNRRANQLANHLRTFGVGPDVLVGICAEPSLELVVGLLGILKAGGAYLPIDPQYPTDRIAFMLEDANCPVVLTTGHGLAALPEHRAPIVRLDEPESLANEREANPEPQSGPERLAYAIYTSGSTGKPKGVLVEHRSVLNLLADLNAVQPLAPGDRCSVWTSFGFDVSVYELFSPLVAGGCLVWMPTDLRMEAPRVFAWLERERIASAYLPPFFLKEFEAWLASGKTNLKRLLVGVEPISEPLLVAIRRRCEGLVIINGYGPTEATICSTLYPVPKADAVERNAPIGRPVANSRLYVLDAELQPVPVGVPGELLIGGAGLARGYLNRPELTTEKFIPNPFGEGRLYRTGDRIRYLPDGNLEFLGRIDRQVKIRGFRVELGEIESTLAKHPSVLDVVVVAREDMPGDKRLVAYIVLGEATDIAELKGFLKQHLPEYMVPSAFVTLDAMPMTPNGKIDRKALPAPDQSSLVQRDYVAPRTPIEQALAEIWADVLKVDRVGIHDHFFDLGGHSLLVTQVASRIYEAFGVSLAVRDLFMRPTVAALADLIFETMASEDDEIALLLAELENV